MIPLQVTAFDLAQRFIGAREVEGAASNPAVLAMLRLDDSWPVDDAVPWCSAFVNYVAWLLRLPRSRSLAARSWLRIGRPIVLADAVPAFDVVILWRGTRPQPGAAIIHAPGHVGFYAGRDGDAVLILGGNQSDSVSIEPYDHGRVLGVRRLV